jgi:hypothetical protein
MCEVPKEGNISRNDETMGNKKAANENSPSHLERPSSHIESVEISLLTDLTKHCPI